MVEDRDIMEPFRTKRIKNIFQLSVIIVKNGKREKLETEFIDAYKGEVGILYAQKLLFRWANHVLKDTELSNAVWEEYRIKLCSMPKQSQFIKRGKDGDCAIAIMGWCPDLENSQMSFFTL